MIDCDGIEPVKLSPLADEAVAEGLRAGVIQQPVDLGCEDGGLGQVDSVEFVIWRSAPEEVGKPNGELTAVKLPPTCAFGRRLLLQKQKAG